MIPPAPINLKNKKAWCQVPRDLSLYLIEDYPKCESLFRPQQYIDGMALHPDCSFLFVHSDRYFFIIHVALDDKGFFYYGYELDEPDHGGGCYPSPKWRDHKKARTLRKCLLNALNHIKQMSFYHGHPPYPLYVRAATEALPKLYKQRPRQMSIFDIID